MPKQYSIAEARSQLPALIREVEQGGAAELTRRGRPVAVVLSCADYRRISSTRPRFGDAYRAWRSSVDDPNANVPRRFFADLRDRSAGRRVRL